MKTWSRFSGIAGLLIGAFGVGGSLVFGLAGSPSFLQALLYAHLVLGAVLLVLWFVLHGASNLQSTGGLVRGRVARFSYNVALYAVVTVGILAALNWIGVRHSQRWDLTEAGVFSLAPQSQQIMQNLKKPLHLVALSGSEGGNDDALKELLDLYHRANTSAVRIEVIDPRTKPDLVERTYEMKPGNQVYLEYGEGESRAVSRINETSEEAITNAVLKLTRGEAKKVYVVKGHEEPGIEDGSARGLRKLVEALKDEHFNVDSLVLGQQATVPEDAAAVFLIAPRRDLLPSEREVLTKYVEGGGRLLMMTDPRGGEAVGALARQFGITVDSDLVVDLVQRLFDAPAAGAQILASEFGSHAITRSFSSSNNVVVFNIASSVRASDSTSASAADTTWTELVKTGPNAWGETDLAAVFDSPQQTVTKGSDDVKGPVALAVAYEKKIGGGAAAPVESDAPSFEKAARVVVFGDSDWVSNGLLDYYDNRNMLLNTVSWLAGEEGGVTIRPRTLRASVNPISKSQFEYLFVLSMVLPEGLLLYGFFVWWRRRSRENG